MTISSLHQKIVQCQKCDRLITWCKNIATKKRKSFSNDTYWGKPVPSFGDPNAKLFILGLAPASHGANRTGRMFTGDHSGLWLYRALFEHGYCSLAESKHHTDSLVLSNAFITTVVHCAPPDNKPTHDEINSCAPYLHEELAEMKNVQVILALGAIAWNAIQEVGKSKGWIKQKGKFAHGVIKQMGPYTLIGSYHPSQQNTFTKRLTKPMFDSIFIQIRKILEKSE